MGEGENKWVFLGRMVHGVMPPVHVQGPVCSDHVAASTWLPPGWAGLVVHLFNGVR